MVTSFISPPTCTRGKVISCICLSIVIVITKIARSQALYICACCNYHKLVDTGEKWFLYASNCWTWLTSATNRAFSIQHACGLPAALTPCADVTQLCMLDLDAGKGRQVFKCMCAAQLQYSSGSECSASVLATLHYNGWRVCRVCALESSSLHVEPSPSGWDNGQCFMIRERFLT